jgi:soluble lytic murein transglycosylase-like protein
MLLASLFFSTASLAKVHDNIKVYENDRLYNQVIISEWITGKVNKRVSKREADSIVYHVNKQANRHKIDPLLLLSIIKKESTFYVKARSKSGARGLMQVMPRWHRDKIKGRDITNVAVNVEVGTKIISDCLVKHSDNVEKALYCYLGGKSKAYYNSIASTHKELKRLIITEKFLNEKPIMAFNKFTKPRQYHDKLSESKYETLIASL